VEAFGPRLNQGRGSRQFKPSGRWFDFCWANNKGQWVFPRAYGNLGQASAAKVVLKLGIVAIMKSDLDYSRTQERLSRAVVVPIYKTSNGWRCIL
jgi:hypothetical protein